MIQYDRTPLKLVRALEANGVPIIGTSPESIDVAEDGNSLNKLGPSATQPPARTEERAWPTPPDRLPRSCTQPRAGRATQIETAGLRRYMREAVRNQQ